MTVIEPVPNDAPTEQSPDAVSVLAVRVTGPENPAKGLYTKAVGYGPPVIVPEEALQVTLVAAPVKILVRVGLVPKHIEKFDPTLTALKLLIVTVNVIVCPVASQGFMA